MDWQYRRFPGNIETRRASDLQLPVMPGADRRKSYAATSPVTLRLWLQSNDDVAAFTLGSGDTNHEAIASDSRVSSGRGTQFDTTIVERARWPR